MKTLKWIVLVLTVAIVAIAGYLMLNSGALAKDGIETYGTEYLGTRVSVGSVELSVADGTGTIRSLDIAQPVGFEGDSAVRVDAIALVLNVAESTADVVVIDRISVDGARIHAIARGAGDHNFQSLLDNLQTSAGTSSADTPAQKLMIRRFDFTNASAAARLPGNDSDIELSIPDVHLSGIGETTGGATPQEVAAVIMGPVTKAVTRAVSESMSAGLVRGASDAVRDKLGGSLDKLRQLGHPTD